MNEQFHIVKYLIVKKLFPITKEIDHYEVLIVKEL